MPKFEIWSEGYLVSGCEGISATATLHSIEEASTFRDACDRFFAGNSDYNSKALAFWGCRLFDNEIDARKRFG